MQYGCTYITNVNWFVHRYDLSLFMFESRSISCTLVDYINFERGDKHYVTKLQPFHELPVLASCLKVYFYSQLRLDLYYSTPLC